jgi:alpha-L-fucosidase 2
MSNHKLEYFFNDPATQWSDALPVGNGRMGAMVYGDARVERIFLSDATFWSGEPSRENNNPQGPAIVAEVRRLLLAGEIPAANKLCEQIEGRKLNYGTNLPFGNLRIWMAHNDADAWGDYQGSYRRSLDLATAVASVRYHVTPDYIGSAQPATYEREVFASHADQLLVVRLTSSVRGGVAFRAGLDGDEQPFTVQAADPDSISMKVLAREHTHSDGRCGVDGYAHLLVCAEGGSVATQGAQIVVEGSDAVTLLLAFASTFDEADPAATCRQRTAAGAERSYGELRQRHIADHQELFNRASLVLGASPRADRPINERMAAVQAGGEDPDLAALLFQFGRYMLIGCSRPDSPLPAHLTGVWNDNVACRIGWTCDCHLDINTQMNYWIAELTNMAECHKPLMRWIEQTLTPSGRHTARVLYDLPGWVAHIFSSPWGFTAPGWSIRWGMHPTGGAWVATHLWDHYVFGLDREFLAQHAYPLLKEAAAFYVPYLAEDPATGWLLSGPSSSPETVYLFEGESYAVCMGPTADRILIHELLAECIAASTILGIDEELRRQWQVVQAKLPPFQIGKHGQIQEWLQDYEEGLPHHRHTSHLLGVFPYGQITPDTTPELAQAAAVSIERRQTAPGGYEEGAWGRNLLTLYQARLQDGEAAHASLNILLRVDGDRSLMTGTKLAPRNAYEMDYNTGATAGIVEMLLQSHQGYLHLLPALPKAWNEGNVRGLCGRGGFVVDITWQNGRVATAGVLSRQGGPCRLRSSRPLAVECNGHAIAATEVAPGVIEFASAAGKYYKLG